MALTHDLNFFTLNCNGLSSCVDEIVNELCTKSDIVFLCEHWLQQFELPTIRKALQHKGYTSYLKSGVDPEVPLNGRPYGGTGFICKKINGLVFQNIDIENDRICLIKVIQQNSQKVLLNVLGVYLPYFNGTIDQIALYSETLDQLQAVVDDCIDGPICIMGDMNAPLPLQVAVTANWHRNYPFNRHSVILYDFLCNNDMFVANFSFEQNVNHTYEKGSCKSYIDHVFLSKYASDIVKDCTIVVDEWQDVSDHLPIRFSVSLSVDNYQVDASSASSMCTMVRKYPRVDWDNLQVRERYAQNLNVHLADLTDNVCSPVCNIDGAQEKVNLWCQKVIDVIHDSCSFSSTQSCTTNIKRKRVPWWSPQCKIARDRTRFWRSLWCESGKRKDCHIYVVYKFVKKVYRNARRDALRSHHQNQFNNLTKIFKYGNSKKFWNAIRAQKNVQSNENISIDVLHKYFVNKFSNSCSIKSETILHAEDSVQRHYDNVKNVNSCSTPFSGSKVRLYIKKLKLGRSPGYDGVTPEHLRYAVDTGLPVVLSAILNTCVEFGVLPDCFRTGLLIPIVKKANLDSSVPDNYRPITLSSIFTKLFELAMLSSCSCHSFHDLQFGFIEGRSTNMAICTTNDIISYTNYRGSQVYGCTLDAEKAFDGVPHSILLCKAIGVIPDHWWRMMYSWYRNMNVLIKWNGKVSAPVQIEKGTRQGGLSSPFLFNLLYEDLIHQLSAITGGIRINGLSYNVFCYADDLLLTSTTVTGLQRLINHANMYISSHGLSFNAGKSSCIIFGKNTFVNQPSWYLNNCSIGVANEVDYLGAVIGNNNQSHISKRIKSCRRSFYNLQSAGLCSNGVKPQVASYLWRSALQPMLLYANNCLNVPKYQLLELTRIQSKLVKASIGLGKFLRSTPLINALGIHSISSLYDVNSIKLFHSVMWSSTRAKNFYFGRIGNKDNCITLDKRATKICNQNNFSNVQILFDNAYKNECIRKLTAYPAQDGLIDSCKMLLKNYTSDDKSLLRLLLRPSFFDT